MSAFEPEAHASAFGSRFSFWLTLQLLAHASAFGSRFSFWLTLQLLAHASAPLGLCFVYKIVQFDSLLKQIEFFRAVAGVEEHSSIQIVHHEVGC